MFAYVYDPEFEADDEDSRWQSDGDVYDGTDGLPILVNLFNLNLVYSCINRHLSTV